MSLFEEHGELSRAQVAEMLGCGPTKAGSLLHEAKRAERLTDEKRGRSVVWKLVS